MDGRMNLQDMIRAGWLTFSGWQMLFPDSTREQYEAEMQRRLTEAGLA